MLQQKSLNESTEKILLNEQRGRVQIYLPMPQIFGYSHIQRNEEEMEQASEFLPIITYIHDESESSDPSESE